MILSVYGKQFRLTPWQRLAPQAGGPSDAPEESVRPLNLERPVQAKILEPSAWLMSMACTQ